MAMTEKEKKEYNKKKCKRYRDNNLQMQRYREKKYRQTHIEAIKEYQRRYYQKNRAKILAQRRKLKVVKAVENSQKIQREFVSKLKCGTCCYWINTKEDPYTGLCSNVIVDIETHGAGSSYAFSDSFGCKFWREKLTIEQIEEKALAEEDILEYFKNGRIGKLMKSR